MADIIDVLKGNIVYIIGAIAIFFLVFMILKLRKNSDKPIDRASIEKKKRIAELRYNDSTIPRQIEIKGRTTNITYEKYAWLKHGTKFIGRIRNISVTVKDEEPPVIKKKDDEEVELRDMQEAYKNHKYKQGLKFYEIVFNPILFSIKSIHLINPFRKEILRVSSKECALIPAENALGFGRGEITIFSSYPIDAHMGWYYGMGAELDELAFIHDRIHETDFATLGSRYYQETQKASVINPDYAGQAMLKEKEIDEIRAKQKSVTKSV